MRKCLFIDRDGTLVREPEDEQIDSFGKIEFLPGVFTALASIRKSLDFEFIMVTNQDGLGTDSFPEGDFWPVHDFILKCFKGEGVEFDAIHIDRSFPSDSCDTRKPGTGMLKSYTDGTCDMGNSFVVGDRLTDLELAANLGCGCILINGNNIDIPQELQGSCSLVAGSWKEIESFLQGKKRLAKVERKTRETDISIELCLDGSGKAQVETGLGFFNHMLEQIARHGGVDLTINAKGDLSVDEHHTVEDTGLVLGEVFLKALGDKKGISRYGFYVPMDDSDANVLVDFGGRPWFKWDAEFKREKVGDMPTELFPHFFKSFSDAAKCNLHVKAVGENEHHKIEAIFKAFARAVRMSIKEIDDLLPSTKGVL